MKYTLFYLALFAFTIGNTQQKLNYSYVEKPLASVIADIQNESGVIFSFANAIIEGKQITLSEKDISLDELLVILEDQTGLKFKKVSESQIIITPKAKTPYNQVLDEVVISGYVTSGIDRNKDGSIDVTSKNLGILPGLVTPDISQSMQLIPGISTLDESASHIQIRGGTPDQNLILFDDIKLYSTGYLFGMFSTFNPYATEKARIFKSGTSAAYGDRISGIIDISTGETIPEKNESSLGIDGLSIDGFFKNKLNDKTALFLFARRSYADVAKSPTYNAYAETIFRNTGAPVFTADGSSINLETDDDYTEDTSTNKFSFYDVNAKLIYQPSKQHKIIFSNLITQNTLDFSFDKAGELRIDDQKVQNFGTSLRWDFDTSNQHKLIAKTYLSHYKSDYTNLEIINGNVTEEANSRKNKITDFGFEVQSKHTFDKKHTLQYGYQLSNTQVYFLLDKQEVFEPESNEFEELDQHNFKNAFFTEYQYRFRNAGFLSTGMRGVHYGGVKRAFLEPRITIEYPISKGFRIKTALERRHQPISQLVEFSQTELRLENNIWRLSDERFPLLKSDQISGGLLFKRQGWTLDIDAYYKELEGLTSFTAGFSTPQLELSQGNSSIKGIDVLLKKKINNYRVWAGYTYNDIKFEFPSIQDGQFSGNNDITHAFRISNTLKVESWQLSLGWQYRTGKPVTPINSFNSVGNIVDFGGVNSQRLKDFHRLDASAIYNFTPRQDKDWKGQLGFSMLNIYNRKTPTSVTYRSEDEGSGLELKQVIQRFSLGFTPNISFRLFF
ncbi:hypothetical protein BFR04_00495 [Gaetbulibacter sp. 4G1]|nr:TonB-dependent receptor [Gaetbulibacter sp. 4G1]PIA79365.1 hypothetical protein BFR04_00495 [Gaetbulibacter sp. 4G1]